jgi:hypothetical protein
VIAYPELGGFARRVVIPCGAARDACDGIYFKSVKLSDRVLEGLADMVVGDDSLFPYRSSSHITRFFDRCGLPFIHDGSTRKWWARERLGELNIGVAHAPDLPSDDLLRVISELFDPEDFEKHQKNLELALADLNKLLSRSGLAGYLDASGRCHVRNTGTGVNASTMPQHPRPLSREEINQRRTLNAFLDGASEDEFTERLLVPLFQRLGFHRVSAVGHKEKTLEFGKDLWMKYQLPTGHWIYFCAQVKREKIDASAVGATNNVAAVLAQARMAIDHPIFDPDANRKVLLDHVFLISAGEITRAARTWLVGQLDAGQRRHIMFMDRDEFLDHSARILLDLQFEQAGGVNLDDDVPF